MVKLTQFINIKKQILFPFEEILVCFIIIIQEFLNVLFVMFVIKVHVVIIVMIFIHVIDFVDQCLTILDQLVELCGLLAV
jgi:hypothetical protein